MRIGIDISPLTTSRTGVGHYTAHMLAALLPLLGEDEILGLSTGLRRVTAGDLPLSGHRHLPLPTRVMYQAWQRFGAPTVETLIGPVDLYHATNYFLPPVKRAKRVLTIYDLAFLRVPHLCSPAIVGPFARHVRAFAAQADVLLTCSEATRQDMQELLGVAGEKIVVAHGAADPVFRPIPPDEARASLQTEYGLENPFLLFVSTLEPRKNIEGLLRAFQQIHTQIPHQLVLIGKEGWNPQPTAQRIAELGLQSRVQQLGYLRHHADLAHFYAAADAFVFPSFYEGFGIPVLEAMACGCPVITSKNSSLPEVAGEAAHYIDPHDIESIAQGILHLLNSPETLAALRAQGPARAQTFTWKKCAQATRRAYHQALGAPVSNASRD